MAIQLECHPAQYCDLRGVPLGMLSALACTGVSSTVFVVRLVKKDAIYVSFARELTDYFVYEKVRRPRIREVPRLWPAENSSAEGRRDVSEASCLQAERP
eukprot:SAG31_NODE_3673_length_3999_cov_2.498974_2_plen_100_part_00